MIVQNKQLTIFHRPINISLRPKATLKFRPNNLFRYKHVTYSIDLNQCIFVYLVSLAITNVSVVFGCGNGYPPLRVRWSMFAFAYRVLRIVPNVVAWYTLIERRILWLQTIALWMTIELYRVMVIWFRIAMAVCLGVFEILIDSLRRFYTSGNKILPAYGRKKLKKRIRFLSNFLPRSSLLILGYEKWWKEIYRSFFSYPQFYDLSLKLPLFLKE